MPSSPAASRRRFARARRWVAASLGVAGVVCGPGRAVAAADEPDAPPAIFVDYTAGFDYSRGDYGLNRTSSLYYVPLGVTLDYGFWRFGLSVPLLYADGVESSGGVSMAPDGLVSEHNAGLGDIVTSASYLFEPLAGHLPWVELGAQILWPSRSDRDLGTGDFGFTTQLDLFQSIGRVTPFATFGRNFYLVGSLDDRLFTSIGASVALAERLSFGLAYDWLEATTGDVEDAHELVPYLSYAGPGPWSLGPYGVIGLSNGSPDFGVGFSVRYAP